MPERYELRQGSRLLRTIDHDLAAADVEADVARARMQEDLARLEQDDEDAGLACDC